MTHRDKYVYSFLTTIYSAPGLRRLHAEAPALSPCILSTNDQEMFTLLGHYFQKCENISLKHPHIQTMTPNPINALKIKTNNTTQIKNTQIHFQTSKNKRNIQTSIFSKILSSNFSAFYADLYGILYILYNISVSLSCLICCAWFVQFVTKRDRRVNTKNHTRQNQGAALCARHDA